MTRNPSGRFAGKVAFVTGGANGIGRETALAFAREGASVVVADLAEQGNQETACMVEALGGRALGVTACDAADRPARPQATPSAEPATRPRSTMKINLKLPDKTLTATLYDTPTSRDFAAMLPLTMTLEDYHKTEKISDLPKKLTKEGAAAGADPSVGDIAYYAPWGNLALFYKDFGYSDGLILLGKLDGGAEALSVSGPMKVTIEFQGDRP